MVHKFEKTIGGRTMSITTGHMAKQAHGSAVVRYGDTMVLVAVVESKTPKEGADFLPLFVDYRERAYAGGKIPGGFFKREGRPSDREVLSARLIDRPIRPMLPDDYRHDMMVMITVLSADQENPADLLGLIGASAAMGMSQIPLRELLAAVRVGYIDERFVVNPTFAQLEESRLDLVVAGTREAIVMVEGGAQELPPDLLLGALKFAQEQIREILELIEQIVKAAGVPKREHVSKQLDSAVVGAVERRAGAGLDRVLRIADKQERQDAFDELMDETVEALGPEFPDYPEQVAKALDKLEKQKMREMVLREKRRVDGRKLDEIRQITCELEILPRVHGSALFTRGQTQALVSVTLGTSMDSQVIDGIEQAEFRKTFMLHYNFPSFSVGEVRIPRGPGRREIGHGNLAERALKAVLPRDGEFPYVIRLVSDILESNGSSSMATVCGGSLAMMDAGVPITKPVAGIAMGLIHEQGLGHAVLTDILGAEDHLGDMDFKVAGTVDGITAFQLDSKIGGIPFEVLEQAVEQAGIGYKHILGIMEQAIQRPRAEISPYAPRIITIKIHPDKIREVIGPGGKVIRKITEETGTKIEIEDDGTIMIASADLEACNAAVRRIQDIAAEPEVGRIYDSEVKTVTAFGAFVEFLPGREGLVHISELERERVKDIEKVVKVGDRFKVKLIGIDKQNRVKLSKVAAMDELEGRTTEQPAPRS